MSRHRPGKPELERRTVITLPAFNFGEAGLDLPTAAVEEVLDRLALGFEAEPTSALLGSGYSCGGQHCQPGSQIQTQARAQIGECIHNGGMLWPIRRVSIDTRVCGIILSLRW